MSIGAATRSNDQGTTRIEGGTGSGRQGTESGGQGTQRDGGGTRSGNERRPGTDGEVRSGDDGGIVSARTPELSDHGQRQDGLAFSSSVHRCPRFAQVILGFHYIRPTCPFWLRTLPTSLDP